MTINEIIAHINNCIHPDYQESWDNSGHLVGNADRMCTGVLIALDLTPQVIEEAIEKGYNLICTHHPILYSGLKRLTGSTTEQQMIISLIKHDICHYAAHTSLDNMIDGVSGELARRLGLTSVSVLRPMEGVLRKLITYCPREAAEEIKSALWKKAGAGVCQAGLLLAESKQHIYENVSFASQGEGTFYPNSKTNPHIGEIEETNSVNETRIEMVYERHNERRIISTLLQVHPYEEPAFDIIPIKNESDQIGGGVVGMLSEPVPIKDFLSLVKEIVNIPVIRTSQLNDTMVQRVALCGGSGSFLIDDARAKGADIFLTGDLKYHDFQRGDDKIVLADIGHFESEQFAQSLILKAISSKYPDLPMHLTEHQHGFVYYN